MNARPPAGPAGPLRAVLTAMEGGAPSVEAVVRVTDLSRDVVEAALDHLVRMGRVSAAELASGCTSGGCGACPLSAKGQPGCDTRGARPSPITFTLRRPRPVSDR
ncbi:FeoC-like transcriptional regulator [Amycolatopsis cynarae]|uniref:FeoC-like transcriptional regulator n=1 Tax=Amycolatopsis cynarae TaxID=2995223 RepID=A0ABY7BBD3_9PSEU|nr:FeoC-like transcriptional regulator [Amycolatopsis sp. HUAS 11-8]WAL67988.1 FeoC-like transcriptional regulator [Amycolatopsis sp. HUAS 11-8]